MKTQHAFKKAGFCYSVHIAKHFIEKGSQIETFANTHCELATAK